VLPFAILILKLLFNADFSSTKSHEFILVDQGFFLVVHIALVFPSFAKVSHLIPAFLKIVFLLPFRSTFLV